MLYQCPLCGEALEPHSSCFACANNHRFDIAKEGYVNLIPANKKRSKNPGDNTEMMQARRRFLDAGHYQPLMDRVLQLAQEYLPESNANILDIGCGEGYYTHQFKDRLPEDTQVYGVDISKVAVRYAAKRYSDCHFSVASSYSLPLLADSLDLIVKIYAPCQHEELYRCLHQNGYILTVTPAPRHLYQLKSLIYTDVRLHDDQPEIINNFNIIHSENIGYNMLLSGSEALDLLQMTPFAWKAQKNIKDSVLAADSFNCEADFSITIYKKAS